MTNSIYDTKKVYGVNALKPIFLWGSFFCFFVLLVMERRAAYWAVVTLPLSFAIASALFDFKKHIWGIGGVVFWGAYFLRFTLFPILIVAGGYRADYSPEIYLPYLNQAYFYMDIELFGCVICYSLYSSYKLKKRSIQREQEEQTDTETTSYTTTWLAAIVAIALLFNVLMYIKYPTLLGLYWRIIFIPSDRAGDLLLLQQLIAVIPSYLYYPFKLTAEFLKLAILFWAVYKVNNNERLSIPIRLTCTIILAGIAVSLVSSEQINAILQAMVICAYAIVKYHKYSKYLVITGAVVACLGFVFVITRVADVEDLSGLSRVINNYFNGAVGIACALNWGETAGIGAEYLLTDVLKEIPIIQGLTQNVSTNALFNAQMGLRGAILPLTAYGKIFFGSFLVFIPAAIVGITVLFFDDMTESTKCGWYKLFFIFQAAHFALAASMYNMSIYYSLWIYEVMVPLIVYGLDRAFNRRRICK